MKSFTRWGTLLLCGLLLSLALGTVAAGGQAPRKIAVFEKSFADPEFQRQLVAAHGGVPVKHLRLINGLVARLPEAAQAALARRPEVAFIEDDALMRIKGRLTPCAKGRGRPAPAQPDESVPWNIGRIGADRVWETTQAPGVKVAIVDTGIDLNHPDLVDNISPENGGGYNAIRPRKSPDDDNGHGTHVAGTVAAADNLIGVVGVGPQISLSAVKVLSRSGTGFVSDVIDGLGWCIVNGMQVANMSMGGPDSLSLHLAIREAYLAGITIICAAGNNDGGPVDYPAAYPETIAVSATTRSSGFAPFSSAGPEVDLAAPGENVYSTYKDGYYAWGSGTSMAAPHVSGTAALVLAAKGPMGPEAMLDHLRAAAEDLGLPSGQQGAGLVRADLATQ
jgi:subtilisin family serine protease